MHGFVEVSRVPHLLHGDPLAVTISLPQGNQPRSSPVSAGGSHPSR